MQLSLLSTLPIPGISSAVPVSKFLVRSEQMRIRGNRSDMFRGSILCMLLLIFIGWEFTSILEESKHDRINSSSTSNTINVIQFGKWQCLTHRVFCFLSVSIMPQFLSIMEEWGEINMICNMKRTISVLDNKPQLKMLLPYWQWLCHCYLNLFYFWWKTEVFIKLHFNLRIIDSLAYIN